MYILFVTPEKPEEELELALSRHGHRVEHISNCQSATDRIKRGQHDVVVADLFFKQLTALELIGQIRTRNQNVVIITTGLKADEKKIPPGLDALGIHAHLPKPLDPELLLRTLEEIPTPAAH